MKKKIEELKQEERRERTAAFRQVVTLDNIDQANLDIAFVRAFVDMIYSIDSSRTLDELKSGTISAMCGELHGKLARLNQFIESVPVNALPDTKAA